VRTRSVGQSRTQRLGARRAVPDLVPAASPSGLPTGPKTVARGVRIAERQRLEIVALTAEDRSAQYQRPRPCQAMLAVIAIATMMMVAVMLLDVRDATSSAFKRIKIEKVAKARRYSSEPHALSTAQAKWRIWRAFIGVVIAHEQERSLSCYVHSSDPIAR
jgi:hypothetical protein